MLNIFKFISVLVLIFAAAGVNAQCAGMAGGVCLGTNGQPYNGDNGQDNYQPQHHWLDNWGAIAIDNDNNDYWHIRDAASAKIAEQRVLYGCNTYNHTDKCEIVGNAYANGCVAYAWGKNKEGQYTSLRTSPLSLQDADNKAMEACQKGPGVHDCVVDYHDCLFPKQID